MRRRISPFLRGVPLPASRGQHGLAGLGASWIRMHIRRRSWGSQHPSQVCSHLQAAVTFPHQPGPRAVRHLQSSSPAVFVGASRCRFFCHGFDARDLKMIWFSFRASLLPAVRIAPTRHDRSCLGLLLFQGCGRVRCASPWSRHRVDRQPLCPASRAYPLLGLRRPSCADVPDVTPAHLLARSRLTGSGVAGPSASYEADASPIPRLELRWTSSLFEVLHLPSEVFFDGEVLGRIEPLQKKTIPRAGGK